uniref:Uncharacterized protein n=1 Tax=Daphnia magna TaxID=35525 RepID=A0A0P4ZEV3_9CRUS
MAQPSMSVYTTYRPKIALSKREQKRNKNQLACKNVKRSQMLHDSFRVLDELLPLWNGYSPI